MLCFLISLCLQPFAQCTSPLFLAITMAMAAAKRRRLQELIGIGGVSDSALSQILESLRKNPIEEAISRQACNKAALASISGCLQKLSLPLVKGGEWVWHYLLPQAVLQKSLAESSSVAEVYRNALLKRPSSSESPWSLIIYFDELTLGNALRPDNRRKTMAVYMSFAELGPEKLCRCEFWLTIAVARTSMIRQVKGGWSRMLRDILRAAFLGAENFASGVLVYAGGPHLLFGHLSNVLADEAALKLTFDAKGSSGLKPCIACKHVCMKGSDIATRDPQGIWSRSHALTLGGLILQPTTIFTRRQIFLCDPRAQWVSVHSAGSR